MEKVDWPYFIWQEKYVRALAPLCRGRRLTHAELVEALGENYLEATARSYGVSVNGRALKIARGIYAARPARELLDGKGCALVRGMHCHIDLFGNYIPPFCPGIGVNIHDLDRIDPQKYPVFTRLDAGGIGALWEYARENGFKEDARGYATKCALCLDMRSYLLKHLPTPDIGPACFYEMFEKS